MYRGWYTSEATHSSSPKPHPAMSTDRARNKPRIIFFTSSSLQKFDLPPIGSFPYPVPVPDRPFSPDDLLVAWGGHGAGLATFVADHRPAPDGDRLTDYLLGVLTGLANRAGVEN